MTVDSRGKGARIETDVKKKLRELTGLGWERVPGSGALDPKHLLKADLYVPGEGNLYAVEVKGYKEDHINSGLLTHKTPQIIEFWEQTVRQSVQVNKKPLLIFKFDRSKIFVAFEDKPTKDYRHIFLSVEGWEFYTALLEDWLTNEKPKFIK